MESKIFKGSVWKQYFAVLNFISDNYLNELTIREEGNAENRKIENSPNVVYGICNRKIQPS